MNGRKAHGKIAKIVRATAKPANEHRGVVRKDAQKDAQMHVQKVVPRDVQKHAKVDGRQVVPDRRETWDQVADLLPRGEDLRSKGEAHRPAGVSGDAMLKRADKAAGLKHVVADKHAVPNHGARRIAARSAAGRWLDRREDSGRPAWALAVLVGVDLAGDADHAALVRRRWLGNRVQVAALDDQTVHAARAIAAPVIAVRAIVRGPRLRRTESISGSTS